MPSSRMDAPTARTVPIPSRTGGIGTPLTVFLAVAVATVVINLYTAQPLIGIIGPALGMSPAAAGLITTLTLLGYAAGLVLLVPLVDLLPNRRLIVGTLAGCVAALVMAAAAPDAPLLLIASALVGFTATLIQMLVPLAAALAPEARRGRVVGNVMSGLMIGTLLSRPFASLIADVFGWRAVFAVSAALAALLIPALLLLLPERRPPSGPGYGALIASLGTLLRDEPVLRRRGLYQFLLMGAFTVFWTAVALLLAQPPYGLDQQGIALFALSAAGAVVVAPVAGRLADAGLAGPATLTMQVSVVVSLILAAVASGTVPALFVPESDLRLSLWLLGGGGFLLSLGVTGDQILGRHAVNLIRPEARGRVNGLYTGLMFLGGSAGAALAGPAWSTGGWGAVCLAGLLFALPCLLLRLWMVRGTRGHL